MGSYNFPTWLRKETGLTVYEVAQVLNCSYAKVYRIVRKLYGKEGIKHRAYAFTKDDVLNIVKYREDEIRSRKLSKNTGLYPKRRRVGNYKNHFREIEVLYELNISQDKLRELVSKGILTVTKFSKNGERRVGYNIDEVMRYKDSVDNRS